MGMSDCPFCGLKCRPRDQIKVCRLFLLVMVRQASPRRECKASEPREHAFSISNAIASFISVGALFSIEQMSYVPARHHTRVKRCQSGRHLAASTLRSRVITNTIAPQQIAFQTRIEFEIGISRAHITTD